MPITLTAKESHRFSSRRRANVQSWISRAPVTQPDWNVGTFVSLTGPNGPMKDPDQEQADLPYEIVAIERLTLKKISLKHAQDEGYTTLDEWKKNWASITGYAGSNRITDPATMIIRLLLKPRPLLDLEARVNNR